MNRIKRFHKTKKCALQYIETLGYDKQFYGVYKTTGGKYWVGTEFEWLNR